MQGKSVVPGRSTAWILGLPLAFAALLLTAASCNSTSPPTGLAEGCAINSDCQGDLICAFGRCHVACASSKDCTGSVICLPPGVCELAQEATCSGSLPCVQGLTCADDTCRAPCTLGATNGALDGCLATQACASVSQMTVCVDTPAQETQCSATLPCTIGLTCADDTCRASCMPGLANGTAGGCLGTQTCAAVSKQFVCVGNAVSGDAGALDSASDAHADGTISDANGNRASDSTTSDASGDGASESTIPDASRDSPKDAGPGADTSNPCPSAQTQFGNIAQGDSNPNFQSGVAVRTTNDLLIFSGYSGPDPAGDGGGSPINAIYVQDFDSTTAASKGPAHLLFRQSDLVDAVLTNGNVMEIYSAAISPAGQIALVYFSGFNSNGAGYGLYAAFLDSGVDAGTASDGGVGLQLQKVVLLETAAFSGQPYVIWSDSTQSFVISWEYNVGNWFVAVNKFLGGGQNAGGSTDPVPTDDPNAYIYGVAGDDTLIASRASGSVGESGNLFGVAYIDNAHIYPAFTALDGLGNAVGSSFDVASAYNGSWVAVAGTAKGFVYLYDNNPETAVTEVFLPASADAGVVGFPDGGDAGGFPTFNFTGAVRAYAARAIADETGGAGGVGLVLQYPTKVSFAYVNADGVGHQGPNEVFARNYAGLNGVNYAGGDEVALSTLAGSFVVSLYNTSTQSTQATASGCP